MDNICMGKKGATNEEVIDAAKNVAAMSSSAGLENGYQTICGAFRVDTYPVSGSASPLPGYAGKDAPIVIFGRGATLLHRPENEAVIQSAPAKLVR